MSTTEENVKRAEECERLAGACIAEANREILLYAAARWRAMAEDTELISRGTAPADNDRLEDSEGATADD